MSKSERGRWLTRREVRRSIETRNKVHACMAHRWNKTEKKTVLRIRPGRDQVRSHCLVALSNKMETGSDFAIGLISSPRWEQDTEQQRRPSNDRVPGNKTERSTVSSTCWQQEARALPSKRLKALPDQRIRDRSHAADCAKARQRTNPCSSDTWRAKVPGIQFLQRQQLGHARLARTSLVTPKTYWLRVITAQASQSLTGGLYFCSRDPRVHAFQDSVPGHGSLNYLGKRLLPRESDSWARHRRAAPACRDISRELSRSLDHVDYPDHGSPTIVENNAQRRKQCT